MTITVHDVLDRRASQNPDRVAFRFPSHPVGSALTYERLRCRALGIAAVLAERCAPGDRALIVLDTGPEFVAALFGCLYAGVTAVAATVTAGSREALARSVAMAIDCRPRCVIRDSRHVAMADSITAAAGLGNVATLDADRTRDAQDVPRSARAGAALVQYTSGTTGRLKGVCLNHDNLIHNVRAIGGAFELGEESVGVGWLPLGHDMGLVGNVLVPLYWNFPVHLMSPSVMLRRPGMWLRAISECGGTISGGPGFAYDLCVERLADEDLRSLDLSTWRVAYVGGEPTDAGTLARFAERFRPYGFRSRAFVPCYGLAESTLFVAGRRADEEPSTKRVDRRQLQRGLAELSTDQEQSLASVGHRLAASDAEIDIRIVAPESSRVLPYGHVGEICIRSASVTTGYFNHLLPTTLDGLLRTGDLGFVQDGELHVVGRLVDRMVLDGRAVCPEHIEADVKRLHRMLAESVAFAVHGDRADELVIVLGVRDQHEIDIPAFTKMVERVLAERWSIVPRAVVFVAARRIRRTTSGKVQRQAMRQDYLAHAFDDAMPGARVPVTPRSAAARA